MRKTIIERALALVAEGLRSGALAQNFHMNQWAVAKDWGRVAYGEEWSRVVDHPCGAVCCIGGWAELALRASGRRAEAWHIVHGAGDGLSRLFCPRHDWAWGATPAEAATAIDRYLAGEEPWASSRKEHL